MQSEANIMHESGRFWVERRVSKNPTIAPLGSVYYQTWMVDGVASYNLGRPGLPFYTANLARAIAHCERMAAREV